MLTHDLVGITNVAAAIACAAIAVVTWRRRALNQTFAVALTFVMAGGCWWSVALAVVVAASSQTAVAIATLVTFPGPSILVTAFMCLGLTIARPQWVPRRWMIVALLVEPVLITTAGATNPWHLLVYRGPGAAHLTTPAGWTYGPVFWLDSAYGYLAEAVGLALVAWGWWEAAPAFRAQRRVLDLNSPAMALVRDMDPHAPDELVGASAEALFGGYVAETPLRANEIVVETPAGRAEYHVQASPSSIGATATSARSSSRET